MTLSGQADLRAAATLGDVLASQVSSRSAHLTIEASELTFIDSTATRLLIMTAKVLMEGGGKLTIAHPQPDVRKTLEMMGLHDLIALQG